jgi:hypothetical protein
MRIVYKSFDSKMASREKLFKAVVDFANRIERKDLITLTHSEDRDNIVVTIWYWTDEADKGAEIRQKQREDLARAQQVTPAKPTHQGTKNPEVAATPVRQLSETVRRAVSELRPQAEPPESADPQEQPEQ